jgi:hypothetical protein
MTDGSGMTSIRQSPREQRLLAFSIGVGAVPFAFAAIRAVRTGYDLRYLWVACASLLGAEMFMTVGRTYISTRRGVFALSASAFVVATLLAVLMAAWLGVAIGPGSLLVGSAFGFCSAVSGALHTLARARADREFVNRRPHD